MGRRLPPCFAYTLLVATLASSSCGPPDLEVATSKHVILRWDRSVFQLCGGTPEHVDNTLEVIAGTYGVSLGSRPSITIFWLDPSVASEMCLPVNAIGCTRPQLNGTTMLFVPTPVYDHELTHAVRITGSRRSLPSFFHEGAAVRWEPGLSTFRFGGPKFTGNLDAELVRELMAMRDIPDEYYNEAGFFWTWLEAEYGPEAMAAFASQIWKGASRERIEDAFENAFGTSIEQAVANSAGSPVLMFDILPCAMPSIPTVTWEGEPLVLSSGEANCQDRDIVSYGTNATRFTRLELTESYEEFLLTVDGPMPSRFRLDRCTGSARPYEGPVNIAAYLDDPRSEFLAGTYVATLTSPVEADGTIKFPRTVITQP
ncbi:MAG: hypothetical protein R6X02_07565 [Enhygromyxa sp.]